VSPKIFLSLVPWLVFSFMINRRGEDFAGYAAVIATALAIVFLVRDRDTGVKVIDVAGVVTFAVLAVACFAGGVDTERWVADYGRGTSTAVLAVIMLVSAVTVPFTEQYARQSVPKAYWHSPLFRAINRKISAAWGLAILVMAGSHLLAGFLDPLSDPKQGARPIDLFFNWVVPIVLILAALNYTRRVSATAGEQTA
jgi:hypothetical protein